MICGLLLAAGEGERFGGNKLLHPLANGCAMGVSAGRHLVQALSRSFAVVRAGDEELACQLRAEGLEVVFCADAGEGMGRSLACGVAMAAQSDGWIVALADMPYIRSATIVAVAHAIKGGAAIAAAEYGGRRGHPVGFAAEFRRELLQLRGDAGARSVLANHAERLVRVPVDDPGILLDIDTRAELEGTQT